MTIQKKNIEVVFLALKETSPNLADARIRDSFLKPLGEALDQLNRDKTAIYVQYCDKNEDGSPKIELGNYHFKTEDIDTINEELNTLFDETVDIPTDNPSVPEKLKELIEKTNYSPKIGEVEIIDSFIATL